MKIIELDKKLSQDLKYLEIFYDDTEQKKTFESYSNRKIILENLKKYENCYCQKKNPNPCDKFIYIRCDYCIKNFLNLTNNQIKKFHKKMFDESDPLLKEFLTSRGLNDDIDVFLSEKNDYGYFFRDLKINYILFFFQNYYKIIKKFLLKILFIKYVNYFEELKRILEINNSEPNHFINENYSEEYKNFLINYLLNFGERKWDYFKNYKYKKWEGSEMCYSLYIYYIECNISKLKKASNILQCEIHDLYLFFSSRFKLSHMAEIFKKLYDICGIDVNNLNISQIGDKNSFNFFKLYLSFYEDKNFNTVINNDFFEYWIKHLIHNRIVVKEFLKLILTKDNISFDKNPDNISNIYYLVFLANKNLLTPNSKVFINSNDFDNHYFLWSENNIIKVLENPIISKVIIENIDKLYKYVLKWLKKGVIPKDKVDLYLKSITNSNTINL